MGRIVQFDCPGGKSASGYLAEAEDAKGAIVVIQEWWGLNDQIRSVADRFAAAGYSALAPDLYEGRVTGDPDEAGHWMGGLDHNFLRLWIWETMTWDTGGNREKEARVHRVGPLPYARTGPGKAADGKPRFNLKVKAP